jgi:hypothetical protein
VTKGYTDLICDSQVFEYRLAIMEKIIRLNAVKTSCHTPTHTKQKTKSMYGSAVASNLTEQSSGEVVQRVENPSISLQKLIEEQPSVVPYLVILSSIAFFAIVLVWAWRQPIEEVGYLPLHFLPVEQLHPPDTRDVLRHKSESLRSAVTKKVIEPKVGQRIQQLADKINSITVPAETAKKNPIQSVPNEQPSDIVCSLNSCSTLTRKPFVLIATLPFDYAAFVTEGDKLQIKLDTVRDIGKVPGRVISVSKETKASENNGQVHRVAVALEKNYVTEGGQTIKLKSGQTGIAEITRTRSIADILLESFK